MKDENTTQECRTRRGNRCGSLRLRGRTYWARWKYKGQTFERSTGITLAVHNAFDKALKKLDEFTAPYRIASELDIQTFMSMKLKTLGEAAAEAHVKSSGIKLGEAYDAFVRSTKRKEVSEVVLRQYKNIMSGMAERFGPNTPMSHITPSAAEDYAEELGSSISNLTFNNYIAKIKHLFNVLASKNAMKTNPWNDIVYKGDDSQAREPLTEKEIEAVMNVAGDAYDGEARIIILIGKNTGMRISDCAALKWEDIDFENGFIRVKTIKTGAKVSIPILDELRDALNGLDKTGTYVLPNISAIDNKSKAIMKFFRKANIQTNIKAEHGLRNRPYKTFHSLRSNFVSMCAGAGVPLAIVQSVVGHITQKMTEHYTHIQEDAIKAAFVKAGIK